MVIFRSILKIKGLAILLLTMLAVCSAISFTASSFLGLYKTTESILVGSSEDEFILYNADSRLPHTSIVPLKVLNEVELVEGVVEATPEVLVPALLKGRTIMVRGVDPTTFLKLQPLQIVRGSTLMIGDLYEVIIGYRVAEKLGVDVNELLILQSAFTEEIIEVKVKGIFKSESYLDYEILAPLYVSQWLRGLPYDAVSLIRLRVDRNAFNPVQALSSMSNIHEGGIGRGDRKDFERSLAGLLAAIGTRRYNVEYSLERPSDSMRRLLEENFNLNEVAVWSILMVILGGSVLAIYFSSEINVFSASREIKILKALGASNLKIYLSYLTLIVLLSIPVNIAGFIIGVFLSDLFAELGLIRLGPYGVDVSPIPEILLAIQVLTVTMVMVGVIKSVSYIAKTVRL